jgi:DNA-binding transcriptional LysR family regulator
LLTVHLDMPLSLGATSLATIMQMVANGYGVTLLPEIAADAEMRDERIKLLRFAAHEPSRTIGLAFRRTSPRKEDFVALGRLVVETSPAAKRHLRGCRSFRSSLRSVVRKMPGRGRKWRRELASGSAQRLF